MHHPHASPFTIVTTPTGSHTLRALEEGETFHPGLGPMDEAIALHVQGQRLAERALQTGRSPFVIWDVGLGAAANAIAAIEALAECGAAIEVHSFEQDLRAAEFALTHADTLGYIKPHRELLHRLLQDQAAAYGNLRWMLHLGDFSDLATKTNAGIPDAILYDPYSPKANPRLWTLEHFTRLRNRLADNPGCTLGSYSRSSAVRVTLLLAGFFVGVGAATGEKDQTTIAATCANLIDVPLDERWLERVRRSTKGAPLRDGSHGAPISVPDWKALLAHPQFSGCVLS